MTSSAQIAGGRRVRRWTRETIIAKILEWNDRYGEPPCSADWNPSLARWRAQEWRAERYREGEWPSTNAAKRPFDGSFDAALRAAGLEPRRPGPRRAAGAARARGRPAHRAVLGVTRQASCSRPTTAPARRSGARPRSSAGSRRRRAVPSGPSARCARRVARRAARASARAGRGVRATACRSRDARVRELTAEHVEEVVANADARVRAALDQTEAAVRDATDARRAQRRAEARAAGSEVRAETSERLASAARAQLAAEGTEAAWDAAHATEARAAAAERSARELALLVCGEARSLTAAELTALRTAGPSGPVVLAAALRQLGRARAGGGGPALEAALTALASAAVRWRDRL